MGYITDGMNARTARYNAVTNRQNFEAERKNKVVEQQTKLANDAINKVIELSGKLSEAYKTGQTTMTPEQYQEQINNLVNIGMRTSVMGTQAGLSVMTPDMLEAQRRALLATPTSEQSAIVTGQREATTKVSSAQAISQRTGLPQKEVYQSQGLALKPQSPLVQVNTGDNIAASGTKKATEKLGEGIGERANARLTQAFEAQRQNAQLDRVKLALARGAQTGLGEESILDIKSFGSTVLGLKLPENISEQELIRTVSNEMALRLRNPESGLGLTGSTSNKDLQFLKDSVVGLGRTEAGNILLIEMMKRFNGLKVAAAEEQVRIIEKNGGVVPSDIDKQLLSFVNNFQFLSPDERKQIETYMQSQGVAPANGGIKFRGFKNADR